MDSSAPGPLRGWGCPGLAPTEERGWPRRTPRAGGGSAGRPGAAQALWRMEGSGCHSPCSFPVSSRQPWALVGILGGDQLSAAESKREYHGNGTTGLAVAQRDFLTYDGTRFTVTAFSGWIKGLVFPHKCLSSVALLCSFRLLGIPTVQ